MGSRDVASLETGWFLGPQIEKGSSEKPGVVIKVLFCFGYTPTIPKRRSQPSKNEMFSSFDHIPKTMDDEEINQRLQ